MAEDWAKISRAPHNTRTTTTGIIHHSFRSQRNSTNSAKMPTRSLTRFVHDMESSLISCSLLDAVADLRQNRLGDEGVNGRRARLRLFPLFSCQAGVQILRGWRGNAQPILQNIRG